MDRATSIKNRTFKPQEADKISATLPAFHSHRSRALFVRLRDRLKGLFNRVFGEQGSDPLGRFHIRDERGAVTVRVEMPGFHAEELDVNAQRNLLIVRAFKPIETNCKKCEADELSFQESYDCAFLPSSVDAAKVEATYCDGVLIVILPKKQRRRVGRALEDDRISHPAPAAKVARGAQRWRGSNSPRWSLLASERAIRSPNTKYAGKARRCG